MTAPLRRETIDHRADRVPIDDQCAEMGSIVAEMEFDLARRTASGQITPMEATHRRRRRHAILATLKWLQENRETVVETYKMLSRKAEGIPDLVDVNHEWDLTPEE